MTNNKGRSTNNKAGSKSALRKRAEKRLAERPRTGKAELSKGEAKKLLHELEVHQIELEMQNEELRSSRDEVETALERYSELFDFAPIGYAVLDDSEKISAVNHAGAHLLGLARSMLTRRWFGSLVALRDRSALGAALLLVREGAPKATIEAELSRESEPRTIVRLSVSMLSRPKPTFLLAFADITAEKRKAAELEAAERQLREQDARKDEFLAMLSHELRNPLTPIRVNLQMLDRVGAESDAARKARSVIDRQVAHLTHIIDDLLDVTRITHGKVRLKRTRLDLAELAATVVDDRRAEFEAVGISLEFRPQPGRFFIEADPTRISQVIANLLGNSRKFTPQGGRVDVLIERAGPRVELRVCDTGAGIAPDILRNICQPFSQAPQTLDRSMGGLGLGLATVKGLIELHGGSVEITSAGPSRGTVVICRLPLVDAPAAAVLARSPRHGARRRVVLIEDNRDTAEGLQAILSMRGHEVRVAHDGPSGLDTVRAFHPEVVICDLGLPGIDGYSLATMLRGDKTLGPLFLVSLSGYARPEDVRRATAAGFDRHIAKPPDLEDLERVIAEASRA